MVDAVKNKLKVLLQQAKDLPPIPVAVVCPESSEALAGAILAFKEKSIIPILIGEMTNIKKIASELKEDITSFRNIDVPDSEAIKEAIKLAKSGEIKAIMKGSLHTDELMAAIVSSESGLRTGRRMSHCMVMDIPAYKKILILSDAALNTYPVLKEKKDIIQNAIDLAHAIGIAQPKVALLSAAETITDNLPETLEYPVLCKMAERGQIKGALLDGPLSFDLAVSEHSVATKKMTSTVAGDADILIAPNIVVGNVITKALDLFAGSTSLGIIIGAKIPVILTSRAADAVARAGSCTLAKFYMNHMG
jgi:phosphate acetyltransferase